MGCFCRQAVQAMQEDTQPDETQDPAEERTEDKTVSAVSSWLAARWLPAPKWQPDPEWQDIDLPEPPMQPTSFSVLSSLFLAEKECQTALAIELTEPQDLTKLVRIVATLNRRMDDLEPLAEDKRPWDRIATLNDQADTVQDALTQGQLEEQHDEPIGPWRPLLAKVKALAPLVSIFRTIEIPFTDDAPEQLARRVRRLRTVTLPEIEKPFLLYRLISRYSAIERLQRSLGADPRKVPFERVERAVRRKVDKVVQQIPEQVRLVDDQLVGMVPRQPNLSQLLTPAVIDQVRHIQPDVLDRMAWQAPRYDQLPLLTTALPTIKLITLLKLLGVEPVRTSPCDRTCDARTAYDQATTGSAGNGTGAAPAA